MAATAKVIFDTVRELWVYTDVRTKELPLVANPTSVLLLVVSYVYFVKYVGPELMKNRKPFDLKNVMIVYNIIQIIWCAYIFLGGFDVMTKKFSYICEPLNHSNDQYTRNSVIKLVYAYYLVKIVDLLDTVFMVLRKNTHQVTFLHVYHHAGMMLAGFCAMKYHPGGTPIFIGFINSFVHCVMYSYYLGAAVNPKFFKTNSFKKYITLLQIVQFALNIIVLTVPVIQPSCKVIEWVHGIFICQNLFMMRMFLDYYQKAYIKRRKEKLKKLLQ